MTDMNDPLIQLHLTVAEIKGMVSTVISTHAEKIVAIETKQDTHEKRLNEKAKTLAGHSERLSDLEDDVKDIRTDSSGKTGRNISIAALVISALIGFTALVNFIQGAGL